MQMRSRAPCPSRRRVLQSLLFAAAAVSPAYGETTYPSGRPITLIVPFAPGGSTDLVARVLANQLPEYLGVPVVVENRPGAGGIVGTGLAKRAPADGHTLVIGSVGTLAALPVLHRDLPYDPLKDFAPVSLIASVPNVLAVNPARLNVSTVGELIKAAKADPGVYDYGSGGIGSLPHLAMEHFSFRSGAKFNHIPYKGTGPALTDLVGGRTSLIFTGYPVLASHIRTGKVRALAVGSSTRLASLPEVPTVAETAGFEGFEVGQWYGLLAPHGTPERTVSRFSDAVARVLSGPEAAKAFAQGSLQASPTTPSAFATYIASEARLWRESLAHLSAKRERSQQ